MSGVVRGSAVVIDLVEGLVNNTTTNEDDNDNDINDTARRATFNAPVMRGPLRPSPECGAIQEAGMIPSDMSVPAGGPITTHGHAAATARCTVGLVAPLNPT